MNVLDFFKKDKILKPIIYPRAQVAGNLVIDNEFDDDDEEPTDTKTFDYNHFAKEYIKQDDQEYLSRIATANTSTEDTMSCLETASSFAFSSTPNHFADNIYTKYNFTQETKPDLIMNAYEQSICDLVEAEKILVIQGPTGCGKSTQVPQYMLNYCRQANKYCKIAVTQPRRIAAISVAKRVSQERGWPLGSVVGYKVSLDAQVSEDTVLTYMTTGVLLQQLVTAKNMNMYTHIILDEVHERDQEMDFLLLVVKRFLRQQLCRTRIILMSATIDTDQFSEYFARPSTLLTLNNEPTNIKVPVIDVMKPTAHVVNIFHLDQLHQLLDDPKSVEFDINNAVCNTGLYCIVDTLITAFDKTDGAGSDVPGSVLIFLPGIFEIDELYERLGKIDRNSSEIKWLLVPLHSSITVEEQKKAFEPPSKGYRKIILSTNIAESSITVPDVVYVIDFCLTKILVCDTKTNFPHLKLTWASRSNCIQRAGRVGRCRTGRVYRLVFEKFFENKMPERIQPEILRCPLHRLVLLAKMLEMGPPHKLLAFAMDRPDLTNIKQTIDALKETGGLLLTTSRNAEGMEGNSEPRWDDYDGDMTSVGHIMARLPLDIHCSRLIIFGHMFGVLKESIIMAAAMSLQNIFSSPFAERMRAYTSKLYWSNGSFSDLIAYLHVYIVWEKYKYSNNTKNRANHEKAWMRQNYLQPRVMHEWNFLVKELKQRLASLGIHETVVVTPGSGVLSEHEKAMMIKVVICGAFYPNYFIRSSEGGQIDEETAVRTIGGRDPYSTVYFTGKDPAQPGELYITQIRSLLKDGCGEDMHISFDAGGSGKVYVQFRRDGLEDNNLLPGKIPAQVYRAVKYRQLKMPTLIRVLSPEEGKRRLDKWKEQANKTQIRQFGSKHIKSILPPPDVPHIELSVTHIENPQHFYVHNLSEVETPILENVIIEALNKQQLDLVRSVTVGQIYAAPFEMKYYRARVTCVDSTGPDGQPDVQVIFIDYGNCARVAFSQLREVMSEIKHYPPLAMKCTLTGVQPGITLDVRATWSEEAIEKFRLLTDQDMFGKIYSIVDGVCSLELYANMLDAQNINQFLIREGYAQVATESFLSQDDHSRRLKAQEGNDKDIIAASSAIEADPWMKIDDQNIPSPRYNECLRTMDLRGPFSPLEMTVYSLINTSLCQTVQVEWSSVNAVLLDTNPQEEHDRLLVAGSISTNVDGSRLILRHTTMMPNLLGFPAIMALIFCPRAVVHTDKIGSRITSVLCGMGCEPRTMKPRYQQRDVVFNLDFDLNYDDMVTINEIREYINMLMEAIRCSGSQEHTLYPVETCQVEIQQRIKLLLKKSRETLPRVLLPTARKWRFAATTVAESSNSRDIWPMHNLLHIKNQPQKQQLAQFSRNIETMYDMAINVLPMTEITCQLCNFTLYDKQGMRAHLMSNMHKQNVEIAGLNNN